MEPIYKLTSPLMKARVVARPSIHNKSPYLVDIQLEDGGEETHICHNPALKCNDMVKVGAVVWVGAKADNKTISKYTLYIVQEGEELICVNPSVANDVAFGLLRAGHLGELGNIKREVKYDDCRFDFCALSTEQKNHYIEVKSAPIADYVNCMPGQRKKELATTNCVGPKMAIFPFGNKQKNGLISERALKHAQTLRTCVQGGVANGTLLYISMRTDVDRLRISALDPTYREAVMAAKEAGVCVVAFSVRWTIDGSAYVERQLEVV